LINYNTNLLIPQEFMCVPSCILLILERKGIIVEELKTLENTDSQQFYLANMLDLRIPESEVKYFEGLKSELNFTISEDKKHNGCNVVDLTKQLFIPLNIPLKEEFHCIRNFMYDETEIFDVIEKALKEDNDVIAFIDYNMLECSDTVSGPRGHALLISDLNRTQKTLTLTNPITEREVIIENIDLDDKFIRSMENCGSAGGISIIKKRED